jgi:DNA transformation protein
MSEYIDYLREQFASFGAVEARRMFGGWGLYHQGLMFALVVDDTLYLKADAESSPQFRALGLPAFEYSRRERRITLSFFQAPEVIYDDPEEARRWASLACEAALRAAKQGRARKPAGRRKRQEA